jgi:hypothetical protein
VYYRAGRPTALLAINWDDMSVVLGAAHAPIEVVNYLVAKLEPVPYTVRHADEGVAPGQQPKALIVDPVAVQVDAGLNELPRAVCVLPAGRDGGLVAAGATGLDPVAVAHVIDQYLLRPVRAAIYSTVKFLSSAGTEDPNDQLDDLDEWVCLFDGRLVGTTRRRTDRSASVVCHLAHFAAALAQSSMLSGDLAVGTTSIAAHAAGSILTPITGVLSTATTFGAGMAAVAIGPAVYTDFWGYAAAAAVGTPGGYGIRGFLADLAGRNMFNWRGFALTGASACGSDFDRKNDDALAAIARIEPFGGTAGTLAANWATVDKAVRAAQTGAAAGRGVYRSDIVEAEPVAYADAGYRFGVPVAFRADQVAHGSYGGTAVGFATDLIGLQGGQLQPQSMWDFVTTAAARFGLAVCPMADRMVVVPFQPLADGWWQTVYASEVFSWDDDVQAPIPVRGVALAGRRVGTTGVGPDGNAPGAVQSLVGGYDSCEPGVIIVRDAPAWMLNTVNPASFATYGVGGPRAAAAAPRATTALARDGIRVAATATAAALGIPTAVVLAGVDRLVPAAGKKGEKDDLFARTAKQLFQLERARYRSVSVLGRFRHDIGPGSVIRLELPADKYVKAAVSGGDPVLMTGSVLRVTLQIDAEARTATTALQVGFVRMPGETLPGSPLHATDHPYWATLSLGVPWADSDLVRIRLGVGAGLDGGF